MTDKPKKIDDNELGVIVDTEIRQSIAYMGGTLSEMRRKAEYYYLGEAKGDLAPPAIEGRSAVVSTDVADTIEWTLPALMEIFTAGDDVVEFTGRNPNDEEAARQTTDVVNYVFYQQNPGWQILEAWIRDALTQKNGILKVWWDDSTEEVREEYSGLTDAQMTQLLQDPEVEPIEHSAYPDPQQMQAMLAQYESQMQQYQQAATAYTRSQAPGAPLPQLPHEPDPSTVAVLHDVTLKRTKKVGKVCVENVPPEEFIISRRAKSIADAPFCGHHMPKTLSELRAAGYENVDEINSDSNGDLNGERIEREAYDDDFAYAGDGGQISNDPSQRVVWITEAYLQVDYDGDGIAEWRKVVRGGGVTLANEECDGPPFVSITPIRRPHRFFGLSLADLAMDTQKIKTSIWRAILDNMYMQINGRTFAVDGQVNLDDLLTTRPGQVVRVKAPGMVGPLQQGLADSAGAYQALEYADAAKQDRTGITKYTQGSDADTLNKTKGGLENITNRADMRIKLIARGMAETGMKDLFRMIQKLLAQYQDKAMTIKLRGSWVDVDPRAWRNQYDAVVNVGLGTGDKTLIVQHLMALGNVQAQGLQIGIATPENIYNAATKMAQALGFKNSELFFTDPSKQPPKPPQPNPDLLKIQAQAQSDQQELQMKAQLDDHRSQNEAALEMQKQQLLDQRERDKHALDLAWEREKFYANLAVQREAIYIPAGISAQAEALDFAATVHSNETSLQEAQIGADAGNQPGSTGGGTDGASATQ
jgi:hypothetical protein